MSRVLRAAASRISFLASLQGRTRSAASLATRLRPCQRALTSTCRSCRGRWRLHHRRLLPQHRGRRSALQRRCRSARRTLRRPRRSGLIRSEMGCRPPRMRVVRRQLFPPRNVSRTNRPAGGRSRHRRRRLTCVSPRQWRVSRAPERQLGSRLRTMAAPRWTECADPTRWSATLVIDRARWQMPHSRLGRRSDGSGHLRLRRCAACRPGGLHRRG